jgi:hypothetical protein
MPTSSFPILATPSYAISNIISDAFEEYNLYILKKSMTSCWGEGGLQCLQVTIT